MNKREISSTVDTTLVLDPDIAKMVKLRSIPRHLRVTAYHYRYKMHLDSATQRITADADPTFVKNVCECWFEYVDERILAYTASSSASYYMNNLVDILVSHSLVDDFVSPGQTRKILAWITLTLAVDAIRGLKAPVTDSILRLLTAWNGQDISSEKLGTLQDITDFLYGKGAWDLYATEVDQEFKAPTHLYKLGLPVREKRCSANDTMPPLTMVLPNNLAL